MGGVCKMKDSDENEDMEMKDDGDVQDKEW